MDSEAGHEATTLSLCLSSLFSPLVQPRTSPSTTLQPSKLKVPTQASSLTHLSLSTTPASSKTSFKSTISINPLHVPLFPPPLRPFQYRCPRMVPQRPPPPRQWVSHRRQQRLPSPSFLYTASTPPTMVSRHLTSTRPAPTVSLSSSTSSSTSTATYR